jgi:gas vesicle protein
MRDQLGERGKQLVAEQLNGATDRLASIAKQQAQTANQAASAMGERGKQLVAEQLSGATDRLSGIAKQPAQTVGQAAGAIGERVEQLRTAVPAAVDAATTTASTSLKDAAKNVGATVNTTAETAAAAVQRPITAVSDSVQAGGRQVRRGVRLVRTALWAGLIGIVVGLLLARTSGEELRRQLGEIVDQFAGPVRRQSGAGRYN